METNFNEAVERIMGRVIENPPILTIVGPNEVATTDSDLAAALLVGRFFRFADPSVSGVNDGRVEFRLMGDSILAAKIAEHFYGKECGGPSTIRAAMSMRRYLSKVAKEQMEMQTPCKRADFLHYVVGFMFSQDRSQVALIRKVKPFWQRGKLNGIGGKVNRGENIFDAMVREFLEEASSRTTVDQWQHFAELSGNNDGGEGRFRVDCFTALGDLCLLESTGAEKVTILRTDEIHPMRMDTIENLPWLISLAIDALNDGRPQFVTANYA